MSPTPFRWQDGERLVIFGRGTVADWSQLIEPGYTLLSTERAATSAPTVVAAAATVRHVGDGRVDELAGALLDGIPDRAQIVALGGGRVIDTAKAIAAARGGLEVAAIPTTLSAAEMTGVHRQPAGATPRRGVRPTLVINDPALSASQPEPDLAASTLNALGHAVEGPLTPNASPVPTLAALEAARLLAFGWNAQSPDRDALALGALLSGYAIGGAGYGLHHVLSQTLARFTPASHGFANAIMLPHSLVALEGRFPDEFTRLADALGGAPVEVVAAITARTGTTRLRELGVTKEMLDKCADEAAARGELHLTPPAANRDEIRDLYASAF